MLSKRTNTHTRSSTRRQSRGFTVFIAIMVASLVLMIGLVLLDITRKQVRLAGIARESDIAFFAANAGLECVWFHDFQNGRFSISPPDSGSVACFGTSATNQNGTPASGSEQLYAWTWGTEADRCSEVSVYKFLSTSGDVDMSSIGVERTCPEGAECTVVKARGYNAACDGLEAVGVVEREVTTVY